MSEILNTIQKRNKLNLVEVEHEGFHKYTIIKADTNEIMFDINFQKGPRNEGNSTHGAIDTDLLEIVRHRLQQFQKGEFSTRENSIALTHIEEALLWLNKRVEERFEREVLGTYKK